VWKKAGVTVVVVGKLIGEWYRPDDSTVFHHDRTEVVVVGPDGPEVAAEVLDMARDIILLLE
jgi:hypothetical protein